MFDMCSIDDFNIYKNLVLVHHVGDFYYAAVCKYLGFFIRASIYNHHFEVYRHFNDKIITFSNLKDCRNYIRNYHNNHNDLFLDAHC